MGEFGDRFEIVRRLGEGGMGIVYEAIDRERQAKVALKTMRSLDATALMRFKEEFRALADVSHPNLVGLHELHTHREQTFFTMELVQGVEFLQHVRGDAAPAFANTLLAPSSAQNERTTLPETDGGERVNGPCDTGRLRDVLRQLARAVDALHRAGKLHRDIKPSNVLVTPERRVVLLDFGLVTAITRSSAPVTQAAFAGTPEYMSPEQASSAELTEASDWYSVGVILYEALTGTLPFSGPRLKLMIDKQQADPPRPAAVASGVPEDLDALCMGLLSRVPTRRPKSSEVLGRLGDVVEPPKRVATTLSTLETPFIGREAHLGTLEKAFAAVEAGGTSVVFVHGASGMGKSLLVRRFLDSLETRSNARVFTGRCYDRETVPYNAFDSVMDALTRHLARLPRDHARALLPHNALALARVFPVLMRVEEVAATPRRELDIKDPQQQRRRAFQALREMLHRIAKDRPLALWVDDVQWADADSAGLFTELLRAPDAPSMLLVMSYRTDDADASPLLRAMLDTRTQQQLAIDARTIEVGALTKDDAEALALALLGGDDEITRRRVEAIANESRGIPFFVDELVRHIQTGARDETWSGRLRLDDVLQKRIEELPPEARRVLEIVSVAGRPIQRETALKAADVDPEDGATALAVLRTGHLVRTLRKGERYDIETYHDRVRETVLGHLHKDELAARHRRLGVAYLSSGSGDPEILVTHFHGAGDFARAAEQAQLAGDRAVVALAFDRAAQFFAQAVDLLGGDALPVRALRRKLGDALANAGRGGDAAAAYLAAAEGADAGVVLDLKRRAAEQLLRSGHFDEGLAVVREVLGAVGMTLPATPRAALASLAWNMFRVWLRGLQFKLRDVSKIPPEEITFVDIVWSVNSTLALVDPVRALDFQKRHVLCGLDAGEPYRVVRALSTEIVASSIAGPKNRKRTKEICAASLKLAGESGVPHARALTFMFTGMADYLQGEAAEARDVLARGLEVLREECTGVAWEIATSETFLVWTLWRLGEIRELVLRVSGLLQEAQERGDLALGVNLRIGLTNAVWLVTDDVARARREVDIAAERLGDRNVPLQSYYATMAFANIDMYAGEATRAFERIEARFPVFRRGLVFHVQNVALEARHLRGRAALAAAAASPDPERLLSIASAEATALARSGVGWAGAGACLLRAGVAGARGDVAAAATQLRAAIAAFDHHGMKLYSAAAHLRLGDAIEGDEGKVARDRGLAFMREQGVRDAGRLREMLAPGFARARGRLLPSRGAPGQ